MSFVFIFFVLFFSGCTTTVNDLDSKKTQVMDQYNQAKEDVYDAMSEWEDGYENTRGKVVEVVQDLEDTKAKIDQKIEDIENAKAAIDKVFDDPIMEFELEEGFDEELGEMEGNSFLDDVGQDLKNDNSEV